MMDLQLTLSLFIIGPVCSCADASEAPVRENCTETLRVKLLGEEKEKDPRCSLFLRAYRFSTFGGFFCP